MLPHCVSRLDSYKGVIKVQFEATKGNSCRWFWRHNPGSVQWQVKISRFSRNSNFRTRHQEGTINGFHQPHKESKFEASQQFCLSRLVSGSNTPKFASWPDQRQAIRPTKHNVWKLCVAVPGLPKRCCRRIMIATPPRHADRNNIIFLFLFRTNRLDGSHRVSDGVGMNGDAFKLEFLFGAKLVVDRNIGHGDDVIEAPDDSPKHGACAI
jgi:hypothetical protein